MRAGRREGRIDVTEEVAEKGLEIQSLGLTDVGMLESNEGIDNGFRIVLGGRFFALNFYQEPEEVIEGHCSVVGVTVECILDVRRGFGSLRHVWICRERDRLEERDEMRRGGLSLCRK